MPRKKTVKSLKRCCLKRIATSFEKHWFLEFTQHFDELPRLLYVIGPFDHWTNELIQELIDVMVQEKCLRRKHFHLILQSSIVRLNLSGALPAANHDSVLSLLANRCQRLTSLNLCKLNGLTARALSDLVAALPRIKVLNLEMTKCNDQVLTMMGNCCSSLVDLNLNCTPVTNSGAFSLCGGFSSERPGCKSLVKLSILYTMIDEIGASYILDNLPNLLFLGFQDICGAIQHGRDIEKNEVKDPRLYQLRNVTSFTMSCEEIFVQCPHAKEVSLMNGLSDATIKKLGTMLDIELLKIGNFHEQILTFVNGLLPYLRQNGKMLTELDLSEMNSLDIIEIGRTCPNLQKFSISQTGPIAEFVASDVKTLEKRSLFSNLLQLRVILPVQEENFPAIALECIFSNATNLAKVQLFNVKSLTSDLLIFSLSHNTMSCLTELKFESCSGVTKEGIFGLLEADNDLTVVSLQKCQHIALRDHDRFLKLAKKKNFDSTFDWS